MSPVASNRRPVIEVAPGGPYVARGIDTLVDEDGLQLSTAPDMALCRCGHSSAKPFCDGAHAKREFTAELQQEFSAKREYAGRNLTVHYNPAICAHVGYCTARLGSVFNVKAKPWIQPDGAPEADVVTTIAACPSGALSHLSDRAETAKPVDIPSILVLKHGPLAVTDIELINPRWADGASRSRYTLCRCGGSRSMPFCDGTHAAIGFRDDGQHRRQSSLSSGPGEVVAASYQRSLEDGRFMDTFYQTLLKRSEAVAALFDHTDFAVQKPLLQRAIAVMIQVGVGEEGAKPEIEHLAERHSRAHLNIDPAYYDVWLDVLCDTVRRHDPQFSPEIEAAWRERMRPGIALMTSRY